MPPETLRISKRIAPELFTVKLAFVKVVVPVVTVAPTFVHVEPLLVDRQSSQLLAPSVPYLAWLIVTVPALATLKFIRTEPKSRTRADHAPVFRSLEVLPVKASLKFQLPEPSVTFAAA